ncbi:hypothetical protein [Streptomyces sp. SS]|uniref:hypothetical protein n=1 Tax=Streptomyces sp. SS TaxID=260742 RepID=UPI000363A834|nr:hypothetical protein [Streptomyces sp. SS]
MISLVPSPLAREQAALSEGLAIVGREELGDLSDCSSSDDIGDLLAKAYPGEAVGTIDNWKRRLWRFIAMEVGDYVVMPRKHLSVVALGLLTGPYEYRAAAPPGFRHVRRTDWVRPALERAAVRGDLRDTMGAFLTVSELSRRDAAARVVHVRGDEPQAHCGWRERGDRDSDAFPGRLGRPHILYRLPRRRPQARRPSSRA